MRRQIIHKPLHTRAHIAVRIRAAERKRIARNHYDQHQQYRHHVFRYPLNAALHAVVHDQRRNAHKQQRKYNRRSRRRDKRHKVAVLGRRLSLTRDKRDCILGYPAAYDRIVRHYQNGHKESQYAQEFPLLAYLGIRADRALFSPPPYRYVRREQRKPKRQYQRHIHDKEQSAAVLGRKIRKAPQVAHTHRTARRREHKSNLPRKIACLLFRLFLHVKLNSCQYALQLMIAHGII